MPPHTKQSRFIPTRAGKIPHTAQQTPTPPVHPHSRGENITDYAGDFVDHFDVDAVVRDYTTELETQLGPEWSLAYDGIEHPADLPRDEVHEVLDFASGEVDLDAILARHTAAGDE